jgi:hypothetical protein
MLTLGDKTVLRLGTKDTSHKRVEYVARVDVEAVRAFFKKFKNLKGRVKVYEAWREEKRLVYTAVLKTQNGTAIISSRRARDTAIKLEHKKWTHPYIRDL